MDQVTPEGSSRDVLRRALEGRASPTKEETKSDPPLHWPTLGAIPAQRAWTDLRDWVGEMQARYPGLDSYVVPSCWYEHESLVGALQALKDYERVAYAPNAPASGGVDWHRALRDMTSVLRQFTADLRCTHGPEYAEVATFEDVVARDIARRRQRAATVALGHSDEEIE